MSPPATQTWEKGLHPPRILIVDDNQSIHRDFELVLCEETGNAELAADALRLYGRVERPHVVRPAYALDHALSGLEAVAKVQAALQAGRPYQMAFVDIRMPGIDGVETIERIWRLDARIQMVICTAYADYAQDDLLHRLGVTDKLLVLKKPFDTIEVTQLALALTEKWHLAIQAGLKLEEMESLVARRTQKLLALQPNHLPAEALSPTALDGPTASEELPLVLLVEADPKVSSQISQGLGDAYRIIAASDGEEGLRQARETVPDLVVAELTLPGLDGLGLCRGLKRAELTSHIPVIVLAANAQEESPLRALEAGADHFFPQPLSVPRLKARVDELLLARNKAQERLGLGSTLPPHGLAANQADAQFLRRAIETVDRHLSDFEFDVEALAKKVAVSRRQLFRKLKAVTGGTPNALIRAMRLKRAAQLLRESQMTVTEVTYAVGFSDLKHFRSVFQEHFGMLPGEYASKAHAGGMRPD
jgi:CheY-like chemotaxis protein/AraC-like DNA-binding protein